MKNEVILCLGSNIQPRKHISRATSLIKEAFNVTDETMSVKNKAIGVPAQPDFINKLLSITTELPAKELKATLRAMEQKLGRDENQHADSPRTIDIDILIWNKKIIDPDFHKLTFLKDLVRELS